MLQVLISALTGVLNGRNAPTYDASMLRRAIQHRATRAARQFNRLRGKQIVHLLHIRKTGGTALRHALESYPASSHYEVVIHHHGATLADVPLGDQVVFALRDPASRFVSGFMSRQRQGRPAHFDPWTPGEAKAFGRFSSPDELACALSSDDVDRKRDAVRAMDEILHLRFHYSDWLIAEAKASAK